MTRHKYLFSIVGIALFAAANCGQAIAGGIPAFDRDAETASVSVKSGDLDLSTKDGARELLRRIHGAAETVCASPSGDTLYRYYSFQPCVRNAMDRAVGRVNNSMVTALNGGSSTASDMVLASTR